MIEVEWVAPGSLTPYPRNWKEHSPEQLEALHASVLGYGWLKPVIVNKVTGHILNGHGRVEMAFQYEIPQVPVHYVSVSPGEERDIVLEFDKIGLLRQMEPGTLLGILEDFPGFPDGSLPLGFSGEDLALLRELAKVDETPDLDLLPEYVCAELSFTAAEHERFVTACVHLEGRWGLETPAQVVLRALRESAEVA